MAQPINPFLHPLPYPTVQSSRLRPTRGLGLANLGLRTQATDCPTQLFLRPCLEGEHAYLPNTWESFL